MHEQANQITRDKLYSELNETIQLINHTVINFYQQNLKQGYAELDKTLVSIINVMNHIYEFRINHPTMTLDESKFNETLKDAMTSIEINDYILLSDILKYDIVEQLEVIKSNIMLEEYANT